MQMFFITAALMLASQPEIVAKNDFRDDVVQATNRLIASLTKDVAIDFDYRGEFVLNGKTAILTEGPISLIAWNGEFKIINGTWTQDLREGRDGYPAEKKYKNTQFIIRNDLTMLISAFGPAASRNQTSLHQALMKLSTAEDAWKHVAGHTELRPLLGDRFYGQQALADAIKGEQLSCQKNTDGLLGTMRNRHGSMMIECKKHAGVYYLTYIEVVCTVDDSLVLRDHSEIPLGEFTFQEHGHVLKSIKTFKRRVSIDYNRGSNPVTLNSITSEDTFHSDQDSVSFIKRHRIKSMVVLRNKAEFDARGIVIPEGAPVQVLNADLRQVDAVYHSGEIVRKVDGAPLAQVEVEVAQARRMRWIVGSAVAVLVMATLGWWLWQRRRATRTT